ncbi:MAG: FAD-dependent oxidoreductase [Elusimicrobia bacterium]|nr:FAD-dependent oxidoreductase [Elusimicrobiota bacterium]
MKDLIIVGGGPAGLTAAVYACRQKIDFRIITESVGGQAVLSSLIENYTGFQMTTGEELVGKFEKHVSEYGVDLKESIRVEEIREEKEGFRIRSSDGECCSAKTVLVATGAVPRRLGVRGEKEFLNRGVAYCAVCDAPVFAGKDVAVVGSGSSAMDTARQLVNIASKVYLLTDGDSIKGDEMLKRSVLASDRLEWIKNTDVTEIAGDSMVRSVKLKEGSAARDIAVQGIFIEIGRVPSSDFIGFVDKNGKGEIKIDKDNRTSREGIFAAGDVTDITRKQVIIAAGEGAKAVLNAIEYLSRRR